MPKPKHRDVRQGEIDDAFMRGFGIAIASIWRLHHDGQMVESIIMSNGFKLGDFDNVDLAAGDHEAIREAIAGRRHSPRTVCPNCLSADDLTTIVDIKVGQTSSGRPHCRRCNITLEPETTMEVSS